MTHAEFAAAWREGRVKVEVNRKAAAGFVLQRALADERVYAEALASGLLKSGSDPN